MDQLILTTTILLQVQTNFHIWKLMQSVLQGFCKLLYIYIRTVVQLAKAQTLEGTEYWAANKGSCINCQP